MESEIINNVIPSVKLRGVFAEDTFAMFITSERIVLILIGKDFWFTGLAFGVLLGLALWSTCFIGFLFIALIGFATGYAFSWEHEVPKNVNIDSLLNEYRANRSIKLDNVTSISFQKVLTDRYYNLHIFGLSKKKTQKKLLGGSLIPLKKDIEENKKMGFKTKVIYRQYAIECQRRIESLLENKIAKRI